MTTQEKYDEKPISAEELVSVMIQRWNDQPEKKVKIDVKDVHLQALDDLVNVNSLMTVAVFVGLGLSTFTRDNDSLENREECHAGAQIRKMLIVFEVLAFAFFLLSSLLAKVIKLHVYLHGTSYRQIAGKSYTFVRQVFDLKDVMLIVAAFASATGIVLLTLSVVNIIQIRIGLLSCGCQESKAVVWALCIIIGLALILYIGSMAIAIYASMQCDAGERLINEASLSRSYEKPSPVRSLSLSHAEESGNLQIIKVTV